MSKTGKQKRVRLNQNPFIDTTTKSEIARRKETFGLSLGKLLDEAILQTKKNYPNKEK